MSASVAFPKATVLGYPRIGQNRELKKAEESYWAGKSSLDELKEAAKNLRLEQYRDLTKLGLKADDYSIPGSFSYYDQVLDAATTFGIVPERFKHLKKAQTTQYALAAEEGERAVGDFGEKFRRLTGADEVDLESYFTIARGDKKRGEDGLPGEMTKWFDTNYHYIVPEFSRGTEVSLSSYELIRQYDEARAAGFNIRPVIVGPATLLALGKFDGCSPSDFVNDLIAAYAKLLSLLASSGCEWVQLDEPALVSENLDFSPAEVFEIARKAYEEFAMLNPAASERPNILLTTPYAGLQISDGDLFAKVASLRVEALQIDLVRGELPTASQIQAANCNDSPLRDKVLVAGVVNGRNIWRADLEQAKAKLEQLVALDGIGAVSVGTSNSLQHVSYSLAPEQKLQKNFPELVSNLSFAAEKVQEVVALSEMISGREVTVERAPKLPLAGRNVGAVKTALEAVTEVDFDRETIEERKKAQAAALKLPLLPTTTIGSFPQTPEIRQARAKFNKGELSAEDYKVAMKAEIKQCVELQEELDIDVLVHGEAERNDMVQYFAENFEGFDVTENGWVQSYGSRCTKPSILWGDVWREKAFTVEWISYAQSLTNRPMKAMLTGPVTILAWSFVRDDQPLEVTANQVALALRDEIRDLEAAQIKVIQVDEPALRELLPLKKADHVEYLKWSVNSFRLATSAVDVATQIHTHLCYSEFEVVLPAIIGLNADVTSIEAARSKFDILPQLVAAKYPLGVGPGVYDIHSPRVPSAEEQEKLLQFAVDEYTRGGLPLTDLWVNPDCGLKTRKAEESTPSLRNMVAAAKAVRARLEN